MKSLTRAHLQPSFCMFLFAAQEQDADKKHLSVRNDDILFGFAQNIVQF